MFWLAFPRIVRWIFSIDLEGAAETERGTAGRNADGVKATEIVMDSLRH